MTDTIRYADLPALGADLGGGTFRGLTTKPDGFHYAVVLLPPRGDGLTWKKALAWAKKAGGELPTMPVSALLVAMAKDQVEPSWYWTADEFDSSSAWYQDFGNGHQYGSDKSYEARAVAVRYIKVIT